MSLLDTVYVPTARAPRLSTVFTDGRVWLEETASLPGIMLTPDQHTRWQAMGCPDDPASAL